MENSQNSLLNNKAEIFDGPYCRKKLSMLEFLVSALHIVREAKTTGK